MLKKYTSDLKNNYINLLSLFIFFFFIFVTFWIFKLFGQNTYYIEILYNFMVAYEGTKNSPFEYKLDFFISVINLSIFFTYILFFIILNLRKKLKFKKNYLNFILKFIYNYKVYPIYGLLFFLIQFRFYDYFTQYLAYEDLKGLYVDPRQIKFTEPKNKKNIIIIYAESLDTGIDTLQKDSPIKEINAIKGYTVSNFKHAPATHWSMGGVLSSMCSAPLYPSLGGEFFVRKKKMIYCLGDVLGNMGYDQGFFITVNKTFHRFGYFFHRQDFLVYDKNAIKSQRPNIKFEGWGEGVHDDDFLNFIKEKIIEKHKEKIPFNYTIITTDTHPPYKVSKKCGVKKVKKNKNNPEAIQAYRCLSLFLSKFVKDLNDAGVMENSILVIMGDHQSSKEIVKINKSVDQNVYFKIQSKNKLIRDKMNHFDVAPTILDAMGIVSENTSRFGFGYSLLSNRDNLNYNRHYKEIMNPNVLSDKYIRELFNIKFMGRFNR